MLPGTVWKEPLPLAEKAKRAGRTPTQESLRRIGTQSDEMREPETASKSLAFGFGRRNSNTDWEVKTVKPSFSKAADLDKVDRIDCHASNNNPKAPPMRMNTHGAAARITGMFLRRGTTKEKELHEASGSTTKATMQRERTEPEFNMFELWPAWVGGEKENTLGKRGFNQYSPASRGGAWEYEYDRPLQVVTDEDFQHRQSSPPPQHLVVHRWVLSPVSHFFVTWNIAFMIVMCYECVIFPLGVFTMKDESSSLWILNCLAATFWSADLCLSLRVGYITSSGELVMNCELIVKKYLRSWFFPDLLIVSIDWMLLISEQEAVNADDTGGFLQAGKMLQYLRVIRILRLLRLRKLQEAFALLDEFFNSEYFSITKSMIFNMVGILMISHVLGCLWYWVGVMEVKGWNSWVKAHRMEGTTWGYQYLTSLHWSLTQLTPGSMDVQPQNVPERAVAVLVLVLGMIVFSSIVSSITAAMNSLKNISARYNRQRWVLRRFLREQSISSELTTRVTIYADNIIKPRLKQVSVSEVELLKMLPRSLYMDVILELYDQDIEVHPFFRALHVQNRVVMQKVCNTALQLVVLSEGDVLFSPGETAHAMYFVKQGVLLYTRVTADGDREKERLDKKCWFCEAVLWTSWVHQGTMRATDDSDLLALDSVRLQEVCLQHRAELPITRRYGREFVRSMNEMAANPSNNDLSDLLQIESALDLLPKYSMPVHGFG